MVESNTDITKVQLFISCRKLRDVETFSKSDPFVEVFEKTQQRAWSKIGQTEVIWDTLNPDFVKSFLIDFYFEEQKYLSFKVFDANMEGNKEVKGLPLGEAECTLGEIVGAKGQQVIKTLKLPGHKHSTGNIILRVEEVSTINNDEVTIQFAARGLEDHSHWYTFHSFKPMFCLSRVMENGPNQKVYSSEFKKGTNLSWNPLNRKIQELCNGDLSRPILFQLYDHHSSGNHDLIGGFEFSLQKITEQGQKQFELEPPPSKKKKQRPRGTISISNLQIQRVFSFLDYIAGGCQINLLIAVDFTGSNGHPSAPTSLHFLNPNGYNQYQSALHSVSEILLNYDSDKEVPLFGFGGKFNRQLSHCFPLNFNPQDPSVSGLEGIMTAYRNALSVVELSGPTLFAQVITTAVTMAEAAQISQNNQQYFILLILTDGEIHDMRETIDWVVRGSNAPLSLVIVGVGNENFANMDVLDADDEPLVDSRGRKMTRDIVQFVPFKQFSYSPYELTKEVLAEIPREIVNFFKIKGIIPNPHVEAPEFVYQRSYTGASDHPERKNNDYDTIYNNANEKGAPIPQIPPNAGFYTHNNPQNPPYAPPSNFYSYEPPRN